MDRSWWRVLTKGDLVEKGMANHVSILALRTSGMVGKDPGIGADIYCLIPLVRGP